MTLIPETTDLASPADGAAKKKLRRLSSMTNEEAREITMGIYEQVFHCTSEEYEWQEDFYVENEDSIGMVRTCKDLDERIGMTIDLMSGIEFSHNGTKLMTQPFKWTAWLMARRFDLFGLIDEGKAEEEKI